MWILHLYKVLILWLFSHILHRLSWVMQSMNCLTRKSNCSLLLKCACPAAAWLCGTSDTPDIPISQHWMSVKICLSKKKYIFLYTKYELQNCGSFAPSFSMTCLDYAKQKIAREARCTICEIIFVTAICLVLQSRRNTKTW